MKFVKINNKKIIGFLATIATIAGVSLSNRPVKELNFLTNIDNVFIGDKISTAFNSNFINDENDYKLYFDNDNLIFRNENGEYIACGEGTLNVSISSGKKIYDTKVINIKPVDVESVSIEDSSVGVGRNIVIIPTIYPENATHKKYKLISENEEIAKFDGNVLYGVSAGETTVTVETSNGVFDSAIVQVHNIEPYRITVLSNNSIIIVGNNEQAFISYSPLDVTIRNVVWESSDSKVLDVDENGKITAIKPGIATITAFYSDEIVSSKEYQVKYPEVEKILFDNAPSQITAGKSVTLSIVFEPEKVDDETIIWYSDNETVAKVDENGVVTGIAKGVATITAMTLNRKKTSTKIEIMPPVVSTSSSKSSGEEAKYCLNLNTKKFHESSCRDIKKMNESNKYWVDWDRDEIISKGYSPCGHCKP